MATPIEALRLWHDFYTLIGTAAATLVGLMFVAASIGAGVFTSAHRVGIRSFLSPTVVHFSLVLVLCLIASAPIASAPTLGVVVSSAGLVGLGYSGWIWRSMRKHGFSTEIDLTDRLLYALLPMAGYLLVVIGGFSIGYHAIGGLSILAFACVTLLLVGIRNAWDMTVWIIDRRGQ
jgi:hypothetical protein